MMFDIKATLIYATLACVSVAVKNNTLKLRGEAVYDHPIDLVCVSEVNASVPYAVFYRSFSLPVSTVNIVATVTYGLSSNSCDTTPTSFTNYTYTCSNAGKNITLTVPAKNEVEHNAFWLCANQASDNVLNNSEIQLFINYPVYNVVIANNSVVKVTEGISETFICETFPCRPSAVIYWMKNGNNITNPVTSSSIRQSGTKNITTSSLRFTAVRGDNGSKLACAAYNGYGTRQLSANVTIVVNYGPDTGNLTLSPNQTSYELDEFSSLSVNCSADCYPYCQYQWTGPGVGNNGDTGHLSIPGIKRDQASVFTCTATNPNITSKSATATISITVFYGPDSDIITLSPNQTSYERVEYSSLSVNCSTDCHPNCQYRWTGSGLENNGNNGMLSIPAIKRDQDGIFKCTVTNPNIANKSATATILVTVLYGPDTDNIILSPNQTSYEGVEPFPLSVNCSTDCYPYCQYRWTGPVGDIYGNTGMLSIPMITRNQTGVFTCTATNPNITSKSATAYISVTVMYGPDSPLQLVPGSTSYRLVEGTTIPDINCTSSCFPSCLFNWTGPVPSLTGVISLGTVNRSKRGNYTCRGKNNRTPTHADSDMVTVIVIYGPDTPVLSPSNTEYTLNESNILANITCLSECFPFCTSYWYKEQTQVPGMQAEMLALGDVYRNDSGTYTCRVKNIESNITREKDIQLVVHYPPTINMESRNGSFSETGLNINCSAHGIPERYIFSLIHSSLVSGIKIRQLIDNKPVSTGVLHHQFRNPSIMDTGVYTCIVRNGIPDYRDGSLDKNVSETVWIKGPPNVTSSNTEFYAKKGDSGILVIEFYNSLLDANVMWNRQRNQTLDKLESSDKYNISVVSTLVTVKFYSVLIQQPGFTTTLEIRNVTEEDFSGYQVYLQNSAGNLTNLTVNLRPRGRPDVPKDVHIVSDSITSSSVNIEWVPGFDGGSDQTFVVEYKTQMDKSWNNYSHDDVMIQNQFSNISIKGLHQDTLYFFQLYARNVFGRSEYSAVINCTTYAESNTDANSGLSIAETAGGIAGGVVVFCLLGFGIFLWRRYKRTSKAANDDLDRELQERVRPKSGLVDNPVYGKSTPRPGESSSTDATGDMYTTVVKTKNRVKVVEDPRNLYAQVEKRKNKRREIYENAYLPKKSPSQEDVYENSRQKAKDSSAENLYEDSGATSANASEVAKGGLLYVDLKLEPPTFKNGNYVIHGLENRTEYAEIAYGKRGDPLPDSNDEKERNGGKK